MVLFAFDTKTNTEYDNWTFFEYPLREAKKIYREQFGLKYRRGIVFYRYIDNRGGIKEV